MLARVQSGSFRCRPPDADGLLLACQVPAVTIVIVECLHRVDARRVEEVLRAAVGREVDVVACVLANLQGTFAEGGWHFVTRLNPILP